MRGAERIRNAILIAGPTASGKSAAAAALARQQNRVIVNTDSMQVYSQLEILTARPSNDAVRDAPHALYGHVHPSVAYSVGQWIADVRQLLNDGVFDCTPPIFVGGTGLYFRALVEGLSEVPQTPPAIRAHLRDRLAAEGSAALHEDLAKRDPQLAERLRPQDGQRIVRALEVWEATGRSLDYWRKQPHSALLDAASARLLVLEPQQDQLRRNIDTRFEQMIRRGAQSEARALGAIGLDPSLPAMRAIGVRELLRVKAGEKPLDQAVSEAKAATRL